MKSKPTNPIALQVLDILRNGEYQAPSGRTVSLRTQQSEAEEGTKLYSPEMLQGLEGARDPKRARSIEVVDATSQIAAHGAAQEGAAADGPLVLLNFASARNPGGGFLGGAKAQEEDICRCSGLYPTLLGQSEYYRVHRADTSLLYTDHLIYSPRVPFFRARSTDPLLEELFYASVITAPAPNAGAIRRNQPEAVEQLPATFRRRWENILGVAQAQGHATVILGAWGCGAFRNDPKLVAKTAREALSLPRFAGSFARVIFPIPGFNEYSRRNLEVFEAEFAGVC